MIKRLPFALFLIVLSCLGVLQLNAQEVIQKNAAYIAPDDVALRTVGDNLDLKAVASIFGDSNTLEEFEEMLNNPMTHISNLDLDGNGLVDYLRVIETTEDGIHYVVLQAVIGKKEYRDVATIELEKDKQGNTHIQLIGEESIYGSNYIIQPQYVHNPRIFNTFWRPNYAVYHSNYHHGYYPDYYHFWRPLRANIYHNGLNAHIQPHHRYNRVYKRHGHGLGFNHGNNFHRGFGNGRGIRKAHGFRKPLYGGFGRKNFGHNSLGNRSFRSRGNFRGSHFRGGGGFRRGGRRF